MASGTQNTQNRGFASMNTDRRRQVAQKGGRAGHTKGTAHEFTADEARTAGRKGGERASSDRSRMAEIGRRGGLVTAMRRAAQAAMASQPAQQLFGQMASSNSPSQGETVVLTAG